MLNSTSSAPSISVLEPPMTSPAGNGGLTQSPAPFGPLTPLSPTTTPTWAPDDFANQWGLPASPVNAAMSTQPLQGFNLQYPANLGSIGEQPYTMIWVFESVWYAGVAPKTIGTIALPVPAQLINTHSMRYDEIAMPIETVLASYNEWRERSTADAGMGDIGDFYQLLAGITGIGRTIGPFNLEDQAQRWSRKIMNPHMAALFKGVNFRKFNLSFSMIAKNQGESDLIKQIVRKFQYHMHPATDSGARFFLYPENFKIAVYGGPSKIVFQTALCVLSTMQINYNGQGLPVFFENTNEPVNISIDLGFSEIEIITKDWLQKEAQMEG